MKEITFKRLSDDKPSKLMMDEIFDCISDDPEFIKEWIANNPSLCMVAHKDLNDIQINKMVDECYVFLVIEHRSITNNIVVGKCILF